MPVIMLTHKEPNTTHPVGVNGVVRRLPFGRRVEVSDEELEVLRNADATDIVITELEAEAEVDPKPFAPTVPVGEGEPATPAATSAGTAPAGDTALNDEDENEDFDAAKFVDRPIDAIREDLDELDAEQLDAVIEAENARDNPPRSTLLDLLEAKKASA